jgi:hypothetical protein
MEERLLSIELKELIVFRRELITRLKEILNDDEDDI